MIDLYDYRNMLRRDGEHLGEVRKNQADMIMNAAFTGDISYRRVYILSKEEGWHFEDARFSKHASSSIQKDQVDSYLQFRPKVHYPIGTYVFIPDDTNYHFRVSPIENEDEEVDNVCPPLDDDEPYDINGADPLWDGARNLWLIVGRTDDKQFVRYLVLQCDWKFRWVTGYGDRKQLQSCWGCHKSANSYTSCGALRNTARCIGKPCNVFLLIAGTPLELYLLQRNNEIRICVNAKKNIDWAIGSQDPNRIGFIDYRLRYR